MPYHRALSQGALKPLLPAPALQEAADASSGQTQHILQGVPQQQLDKAGQPQTPAASAVPLSTKHGQQAGSAARRTVSPGIGGAQSRPALDGRPPAAKIAGQEHRLRAAPAAAEPPISRETKLAPGRAALTPQEVARQPVQVQADIVDLVSSSSDDSWSSMPAAQQARQGDVQSARREGVLPFAASMCTHKCFHAAHRHCILRLYIRPGSKLQDCQLAQRTSSCQAVICPCVLIRDVGTIP